MRIKKIPYNNTSLDFEIINDCLNKPIHQAHQDMMAMVELVLNYSKDEKKCDRQTAEIIEYINENFTQHDLSLCFLADRFFMSQSKMSSLLSSQLNMGFHAYLSGLRINKAKDLIINTDKSIDEICDECGFSSRQTFFRIFKSTVGMTTTEYYNSHKS